MDERDFRKLAVKEVVKYHNRKLVPVYGYEPLYENDIYVVWMCKVLKNNKALLSTPIRDDMYYEFIWDGENNVGYLDAYRKASNIVVRNV